MSADQELEQIVEQIKGLESRFIASRQLGPHLSTEDEAKFKSLAIEAKSILSDSLGPLNDFSTNLFHTINSTSGGFLGGPSVASVTGARALIEGGINRIRKRSVAVATSVPPVRSNYVDSLRLGELKSSSDSAFDLTRLVRLAEELNVAHQNDCHMSVAMLLRAITDHVPPIFGFRTFSEVANNYAGAKSFRQSTQHLDRSLRNIADAHLHVQVRGSEVLPTAAQVDFRADLDVLLGEIVRLLK
jgi:hypothetical protein